MSAPPHILNVYRKPREAISGSYASPTRTDGLLAQYVAFNYEHTKLAIGGDDTARCAIAIDPLESDMVYWNYVGNRVTITVDNPVRPIFEGYIESVSIAEGATKRVRSIAEMANALTITYYDSGGTTQTTPATNAASIATYGTKQKTFDAGNKNNSGSGFANAFAAMKLANISQPLESVSPNSGGGFSVEIAIKGFYHTWDWLSFEVSDTTFAYGGLAAPSALENAYTAIFRHLFSTNAVAISYYTNPNGSNVAGNGWGIFYNDGIISDLPDLAFAIPWSRTKERTGGQTLWQFLQETVQAGDGTNRWVIGINPTGFNNGYRNVYYRQANTNIDYMTDPAGTTRILDTYGSPLRAWVVQPDRQIRIVGGNVGQSFAGINTKYISKIQYKAETQEVTWYTENDNSLEGVFQIGEFTKSSDALFGSSKYQFW